MAISFFELPNEMQIAACKLLTPYEFKIKITTLPILDSHKSKLSYSRRVYSILNNHERKVKIDKADEFFNNSK
jgi:hypothetical protein